MHVVDVAERRDGESVQDVSCFKRLPSTYSCRVNVLGMRGAWVYDARIVGDRVTVGKPEFGLR
jgi:hypothetical protein